jgi:hypothetical protein
MLLTLMVFAAATLPHGCTLEGIIPEPETGVSFDLTPFLGYRLITLGDAHVAMPVRVRACVRERYSSLRFAKPKPSSSCTSVSIYAPVDREDLWDNDAPNQWDSYEVFVKDPPLTWERPIAVRLTMWDEAGNSIFNSSAVVQPYTVSYEPSCYGVIDVARVVATRPGRLAPYKVWEPNS